jgi:hypothetical protein
MMATLVFYVFLSAMIMLGVLLGAMLQGDGKIKQMQAGMFYGFSLGCLLILIMLVTQ